jgi:hypothetical protein
LGEGKGSSFFPLLLNIFLSGKKKQAKRRSTMREVMERVVLCLGVQWRRGEVETGERTKRKEALFNEYQPSSFFCFFGFFPRK